MPQSPHNVVHTEQLRMYSVQNLNNRKDKTVNTLKLDIIRLQRLRRKSIEWKTFTLEMAGH